MTKSAQNIWGAIMVNSLLRYAGTRIVPILVIIFAISLGWLSQQEFPLGVVFATFFPLRAGQLPSTIVGHGYMSGTPPVPEDMMPRLRPSNEIFKTLPGGYQIPQMGIGMCCRASAYDDVLVFRIVLWYLLLGGRHIDGAHLYLNHAAIGDAIHDATTRRGIPREEIFVTTKIFPTHYGYNSTLRTVTKYLEELKLEYLDLVLMHFPVASIPLMTNDCDREKLSPKECRLNTYRALSELKHRRLIRNVGVSNFAVPHLREIQELIDQSKSSLIPVAPLALNQFQFNPWAPDFIWETRQYCLDNNIAITAYASLGGTLQKAQASTVQALQDIANKHKKTVQQVMLRWAIQSDSIVIPGTGNPKHMEENLNVYSFQLDDQDMNIINELKDDQAAKKFFYMPTPKD
jgi:diketogulonate reductase-like aldo/keto reductase